MGKAHALLAELSESAEPDQPPPTSITADTYTSVLTEIARQAADAIAARIPRTTSDSAEPR